MEVGFYYVGVAPLGAISCVGWQERISLGRDSRGWIGVGQAGRGEDVEFPIMGTNEKDLKRLVITPEGMQRGFESENPPECRDIPFPCMPLLWSSVDDLLFLMHW